MWRITSTCILTEMYADSRQYCCFNPPQTKIDGEKLVLAANGRGGLSTVALRPSGIFGEVRGWS